MMFRSETILSASGSAKLSGAVILLFLILSFLPCAHAYEKFKEMTAYDLYFRNYSNLYFGSGFDWRCFKAQAIVESSLKPNSQSQDGAIGIMQISPRTFREITLKNPDIWSDPKHPRWNIAAGIYYNRYLWEEWQDHPTLQDRISFMLGSYNAGKGTILKAKKAAKAKGLDARSWKSVARVLEQRPGFDTAAYVKKVNQVWTALQQ